MALADGAQMASYRITGLLGAGGMGEVYRARDTKLNRDVAIKVLPAEFAKDPERVARFHREAQTVAALNHPNIAAIYELAEFAETFTANQVIWGKRRLGVVTSGVQSPHRRTGIGLGYVISRYAQPGLEVEIEVRDREIAAKIVELPFYRKK